MANEEYKETRRAHVFDDFIYIYIHIYIYIYIYIYVCITLFLLPCEYWSGSEVLPHSATRIILKSDSHLPPKLFYFLQ